MATKMCGHTEHPFFSRFAEDKRTISIPLKEKSIYLRNTALYGNKLKVLNIVENLSNSEMYFSVGAHEGYVCPEGIEEYELHFDEKQTLDSYILNGNLLENNSVRIIEDSNILPLKYEYFKVDALVFKNIKFK